MYTDSIRIFSEIINYIFVIQLVTIHGIIYEMQQTIANPKKFTAMKKLLFIVLMLSFLIGNAQQNRPQYGPNSTREPAPSDEGINLGFPSEVYIYMNTIRKTDNHPAHPSEIYLYKNSIRKTDNHPGYPSEIDLNRYSIRKTDNNAGYPSEVDLNRYTIRKPY
jgi:hypothetical protein